MCCINKGRVCWSFPPTPSIFWEKKKKSLLSLRNEVWLRQSSPPLLSWVLVYVCVCFLFISPISLAFSRGYSHPSSNLQRISSKDQLVPRIGYFPRTQGGFHRKSMAAYFPLYCGFLCGLTWPQPYQSILQSCFHSDVPLYKQRKLVEGQCQTACHILFSICWNQVYSVLLRTQAPFELHNAFQEFYQARNAGLHVAIKK